MENSEITQQIKEDLGRSPSMHPLVSYFLLDDGTLAVFEHEVKDGYISRVRVVNVSLGRELTKEEWQGP